MWTLIGILSVFYVGQRAKAQSDLPAFDTVVKDVTTREGMFTLYHQARTDRLMARIPQSYLGRRFLLASSIGEGREFAGFQWQDFAVYWERRDKKLLLIEADPRFRRNTGAPVDDAIQRTYTDRILRVVPIVTEKDGDPVIDLDPLFKQDLVGLNEAFRAQMNAELSRYATIKVFPENLCIAVSAAMMRGTSGEYAQVYYSFSNLPEPAKDEYQPRVADNRIGYFLTVQKDWSRPHDDDTVFNRLINRWRLRKAEPDKAVSDVLPKDQIVFYIEKTVPVPYRPYVRDGILEWNKAFEKAGLRNAIQVRQQTDTNEFKDLDPEDVRYNFFRWIVSGRAFAMGPSRVNPFTGQILDADIIMDDAMVRWMIGDEDVYGPRAIELSDPLRDALLSRQPSWDTGPILQRLMPDTFAQVKAMSPARWTPSLRDRRCGAYCEMGIGMTRELAFNAALLQERGEEKLSEDFIGQAIKETVMHEVGHTLGLRHNFKASSWKSLADILQGPSTPDTQTTGSVMDYNPYMYAETVAAQGAFVTRTLGPYDYWAIEYGYRVFTPGVDDQGDKPVRNEKEMLARIASRCTEPGLTYATDEDTSDLLPDPLVYRFDNGSDPLDFARYMTSTVNRLVANCEEWAVKEGESYEKLRRRFNQMLGRYGQAVRIAARWVGGQFIHRDQKGDPNERSPIQPVPATRQREAVEFLAKTVFAPDSFNFRPQLVNLLAPNRWSHWDGGLDAQLDYAVADRVLAIQSGALFQLLNPVTLARLHNSPLTTPSGEACFTETDLLSALNAVIWSELKAAPAGAYTSRQPFIVQSRRLLQRRYVQALIENVVAGPLSEATVETRAAARTELRRLSEELSAVLARPGVTLDPYSKAHLVDTRRRIEKALTASYVLN